MTNLLNTLLVIVLMLNLFALGTSRIVSVIRTVAAQGALLGLLPILLHDHLSYLTALTVVPTIALKGIVIPGMMIHALRAAFHPLTTLLSLGLADGRSSPTSRRALRSGWRSIVWRASGAAGSSACARQKINS